MHPDWSGMIHINQIFAEVNLTQWSNAVKRTSNYWFWLLFLFLIAAGNIFPLKPAFLYLHPTVPYEIRP